MEGMLLGRDNFIQTVVMAARLVSVDDNLFSSAHVKIVATEDKVRSYCSGHDISVYAYVPCEKPVPGTYYFARKALEAFATKLTAEDIRITKTGSTNVISADQRIVEFDDPSKHSSFSVRPKSKLTNLDTLSETDAAILETIAGIARTSQYVGAEYHCVYAAPAKEGSELFASNELGLAWARIEKNIPRPIAIPVALAKAAKFGNLLLSDTEVGIENYTCFYWCQSPLTAQNSFPVEKCRARLDREGEKLFEIDGKDMGAAVDLLERAFGAWETSSDAFLELDGNNLTVRVRFPSTKFEEKLRVRGTGSKGLYRLPFREHAKMLPALSRQSILRAYLIKGKTMDAVRFDGEDFKLLLPRYANA